MPLCKAHRQTDVEQSIKSSTVFINSRNIIGGGGYQIDAIICAYRDSVHVVSAPCSL
jgi:hypothetical protein